MDFWDGVFRDRLFLTFSQSRCVEEEVGAPSGTSLAYEKSFSQKNGIPGAVSQLLIGFLRDPRM